MQRYKKKRKLPIVCRKIVLYLLIFVTFFTFFHCVVCACKKKSVPLQKNIKLRKKN